jgi:hypothetical protein
MRFPDVALHEKLIGEQKEGGNVVHPPHHLLQINRSAGIFKKSMGARNRVGIGCTGPPGYIGWRNSFLRIDSWAP